MNAVQKLENWGAAHHPKWLFILRAALGFTMLVLIRSYVLGHRDLRTMLSSNDATLFSAFLAFYMILVQFMGGFLIIAGLITRIAILFQLPVVIGALVSPWLRHGLLFIYSDLPLTLVMFLVMVLFLIEGSGPISMDNYIKKRNPGDVPPFEY